jgi:hypothetical protein
MLSGFNSIQPVKFFYQNDSNLLINQNTFATQQGLELNLVNALSGCKDETILNYSNVFLSKAMSVNDVVYLPTTAKLPITFPTYLGLSAYPADTVSTFYVAISSDINETSSITFNTSLSNTQETYFGFYSVNGVQCKIFSFDNDYTKYLTVDTSSLSCTFTTQTSAITATGANLFEFALDDAGFMKLFFRSSTLSAFYIIRYINNTLSAVNVSTTTPLTSDIFKTTYNGEQDIKFKNDFIYYNKSLLKDFIVKTDRTVEDVPQNHVLYYNYQATDNFLSGSQDAYVDFFKTKNVLSNNYYINDKLPFKKQDVLQRNYTTILSKQNSELFEGDFQLNYNYYTDEFLFLPDVATKFTLPKTLFPYSVMNIDNSNLVNVGAYGGLTPVFSDKVVKQLNPNTNVVNYNEANGIYLYTWLYTDTQQLTSYWLDRYYFPGKTSINVAYSGSNNQIFTYQSQLSTFLNANYPANDYAYYDIRSSLTFEASATYYYSRIGNRYISKVIDSLQQAISGVEVFDSTNVFQNISNTLTFAKDKYGAFKLSPDLNNSFTIAFNIVSENVDNINSNLIVGNNFDEGISLYKGGAKNIFTPGYLINSLTGLDFHTTTNENTYNLNLSTFTNTAIKTLDIINTGFDHIIKAFYYNVDTGIPGFLDFSYSGKVLNYYEFPILSAAFVSSSRINLFDKVYVGDSEIWYLVKPGNGTNTIYKFDYLNNVFLGTQIIPNINAEDFNSIVTFNGYVSSLSGYCGDILDNSIGVSKKYSALFFKDLSANTEYPVLSAYTGGIFDVITYGDKFYLQTNGLVRQYDKYKRRYNTYYTNSKGVSGVKLDIINDNYQTKLLAYTADINSKIIVDRFDLTTGQLENTYETGIVIDPIFFNEYLYPKKGSYTDLAAIGIVNAKFISGGSENEYTYGTSIIGSLTSFPINAVIGAQSLDSTSNSILSGTLDTFGANVPFDVKMELYQGSTLLTTITSNGNSNYIDFSYQNVVPNTPYSLVASRSTENATLAIRMILSIQNGTFYNGSFRNIVVGGQFDYPTSPGFANAFTASNTISLTEKFGFVGNVNAKVLDDNNIPLAGPVYSSNVNFNDVTTNPYNNFYHAFTNPHLYLTVNPTTSSFQPTLIEFTSNTNPTLSNPVLSGVAFQTPVNFNEISDVNKFEQGDMIARVDLYSGNNYKNKQTEIIPFNVDNESQITMSFDPNNGYLTIYRDAEVVGSVSLSANTFYTSYFLNNNFGVGIPFVNNKAASTIGQNYVGFANNYTINNFVVYDKPLTPDEVKFNFLQNKTIDPVNFDIPQGTRNNTDTFASFNRFTIPGRKNNNVKIYIKNANLTPSGEAMLTEQLLPKIRNIVPLNTDKIDLIYLNYE